MAGGAFQTPFLMQLSGIGEKAVLDKLGIETVVDLPGVGANLQDHAGAFTVGLCKSLSNPINARRLISNQSSRECRPTSTPT